MEGTFDPHRHAILFDCLALAHMELGHLDLAIENVHRSIELHALTRNKVNLARAENNLGYMLMQRRDWDESRAHLERSLQLHEETDLEVGRCQVFLSLAELSLAQGRTQYARELAMRGLEFAARLRELSNAAQAHAVLGQIAEALSDPDVADAEFKHALAQFARHASRGWLQRCHRMYADILDRRGQVGLADAHRKKAARYQPVTV